MYLSTFLNLLYEELKDSLAINNNSLTKNWNLNAIERYGKG